ncbi:MAG: ATP-binding protein [Balneolales bacterium]|nr:ATP-binding protein [Balneolales bacterium]
MTKKKPRRRVYKLGIRVAVYTSFISAIITVLVIYLLYQSITQALAIAGLVMAGSFITTYLVSYRLQFRRLQVLERVSRNISKKRFEEIEDLRTQYDDEMDFTIKHIIKSSRTVEREISRLNRIENYRKEFIGDISHELKTPIFAIQGFIETLLNGALEDPEVNRKFLQKAMRNVNRLIFLTKDLMEISRLETGELKSDIESLYLYETILDIVESLTYKAEKEEVNLVVHNFDQNLQIRADRNQIKQVLVNIIENGIKYNVPGGKVEIGIQDHPKNEEKILLFVKDTGIGIDEMDLPRVTERFFRVDKSRSRERGGTGLGLAIVKHIIEAHGEKLTVSSTPNEGSTFNISLTKVVPLVPLDTPEN